MFLKKGIEMSRHIFFWGTMCLQICQSDGENYYNQTFEFVSYLILLDMCPLTSIMEYQVK